MFRAKVTRPPAPIGGKGWQKQGVWIYLYDQDGKEADFPVEFPTLHEAGKPGFAPGDYLIDPSSFVMGRDEKGNVILRVGRLRLTPANGAGAAAKRPT